MKTAAFVTLALALAACSSEPLGHKWQVDKDGKPIQGTQDPVWTADDVVALRQAFTLNVGYIVDCGSERFAYPGEAVLFDGTNYTGECSAIHGSADFDQNMVIPYDEPTATWQSGKSWNDAVDSMKGKAQGVVPGVGTIGTCIRLRQTTAGGDLPGFGNALFELGTTGELNLANAGNFAKASFIVVRNKAVGETTCPL